jgi:hypothetical protein
MAKKIIDLNIFERIAYSTEANNKKAQHFLVKNGYEKAVDQDDLAEKLAEVLADEGEAIIPELLALHPDAEHFKSNMPAVRPAEKEETPVEAKPIGHVELLKDCGCKYNADCGHTHMHNAGGDDPTTSQAEKPAQAKAPFYENYSKHMPAFAVGVVLISIGIGALISHTSKSK